MRPSAGRSDELLVKLGRELEAGAVSRIEGRQVPHLPKRYPVLRVPVPTRHTPDVLNSFEACLDRGAPVEKFAGG